MRLDNLVRMYELRDDSGQSTSAIRQGRALDRASRQTL
jgi:hypothetical protein